MADITLQTKLEIGIDLEGLAQSAYKVWAQASGKTEDWQGLGEEEAFFWGMVVLAAYREIINVEEISASALAAKLYAVRNANQEHPLPLSQVPAAEQVIWDMVTRHLAMVIDADDDTDLGELEKMATEYAARRLEAVKVAVATA